jgi:phosphatidylglycerol lysyltransferase
MAAALPSLDLSARLRPFLLPALSLALFLAAVAAIHHELATWSLGDVTAAVDALPTGSLAAAVLAAALGYAVLALYDPLALRYLGKPVPLERAALAGFVGYAFSHTIGLPLLTGSAVRYRLYTAWGLSAVEIATIVGFNSVTLWLGVAAMVALGGIVAPAEIGRLLGVAPALAEAIGTVVALVIAAYVAVGRLVRKPLAVGSWQFTLPSPSFAALQLVVATVDWLLAAATLWVLLPQAELSYAAFACVFTVANVAGIVSHVPAGLGVFEAVVLLALPAEAHLPSVAAALIAYRLIYYLLPMVVAALLFAWHQTITAQGVVAQRMALAQRTTRLVLPNLLAALVFIGGIVLLISGATPAAIDRLVWLAPMAPLALIELSHFLASLVGLALLVLALGLRRRLDGAYWAACCALPAGIVLSLLKGVDWEEALYLALVLAALLPCHGAFYRRSHLVAQRFSPSWFLAVTAVVLGSVWLGLFSYRHIDYTHDLWWQFVLEKDAPRFLRATAGVMIGLALIGGLQLFHFAAPHAPAAAGGDGPEQAIAALSGAEAPPSGAWLAALGDKRFLFSDSGRSFIMYGVQGRSWIALGAPVGLREERQELLWRFRELCDGWGGRAVFYEIGPELMPELVELGLAFHKLGEQAFVPLDRFSLEGSARAGLRQSWRRAQRDAASFEVAPPERVEELLPELQAVSDLWLEQKGAKEKGFSLGRFDPAYLRRFPFALVRKQGRLVAFANLWTTPDKGELSVDLMRYQDGAVRDVMDYLFVEIMLWGKGGGYRMFDLGMAPLSGLQSRPLAPLWVRAGALVFRYGEQFYNFEGLCRYKDKFKPVWEPRYLAAPGGLALAAVLADATVLIGGSAGGVLPRQEPMSQPRPARHPGSPAPRQRRG